MAYLNLILDANFVKNFLLKARYSSAYFLAFNSSIETQASLFNVKWGMFKALVRASTSKNKIRFLMPLN